MDFEQFKSLHTKFKKAIESGRLLPETEQEFYQNALEVPEFYEWTLSQYLEEVNFDYSDYCCVTLAYHISKSLNDSGEIQHEDFDVIINKWNDGSFGIPIHDGGSSIVKINFCPWCGTKLNNDE